jgi:hypothetical protein
MPHERPEIGLAIGPSRVSGELRRLRQRFDLRGVVRRYKKAAPVSGGKVRTVTRSVI